ncbi:hypothetical protein [Candidatus Electronema sp. JM]|uniref:hypothetical protein n=1 Tax=Candidatus Electronema sp. JM TaxID=3401571 RepID=UPI003AA895AD
MTKRAQTIDEVYQFCNPDKPLPPDDKRYVDLTENRGVKQIAKTVTRRIKRSEADVRVKLLFTGHRGSGKTTELLRLQQELEDNQFFTIYMDVEEMLDLGSLSYLDVLVAMAKEVEAELARKKMPLSSELLNGIAQWFSERIVEESKCREMQGSLSAEAKAGSAIPFFAQFFASATASVKAGSSQRETIRTVLKRELNVFIDRLNLLLATAREKVQANGCRDIVLIVDGMEKMHYELNSDGVSTHTDLFIRHAEQLRAPQCHIIYTVPVSLAYNQNLGADFDDPLVLPMVRTDAAGIAKLTELVERRVDTQHVFAEPQLLELLVRASGGVVRDLMRLVRLAADTDADSITAADVNYALKTLRNEYDRLIRSDDLPILRRIQQEGRIQVQGGDEKAGRLLNLRLVLEYQNDDPQGERWAALHPAAAEIPWVKAALAAAAGDDAV